MDLLTGYGSDASEGEEDAIPRATSAAQSGSTVPKGPSTLMPPPASTRPSAKASASTEQVRDAAKPSGEFNSNLWSRVPKPSANTTSTSGLPGLPPPSADARTGRKVVTMQLPFRKELLAAALDSDDEDEPAAKRVKATGAKSRLMDFLPPPKNDRGGTAGLLGSGAAAPPATSRSAGASVAAPREQQGADAGPSQPGAAAAGASSLPADFFTSNEAYRVRDGDEVDQGAAAGGYYPAQDYAAQYAGYGAASASYDGAAMYAPRYGAGPPAPPLQYPYGPPAGPGPGPGWGATGSGAPALASPDPEPEDLIEAALRAEQERASKRGGGGGGVKLVEINAKELQRMDPSAKAAANARDALGTEYALALRRSAAPFEGSKMAKRKHQIGTLLFNARLQELEQMEKRTQGQKTKAETAAKYGW